MCRAHTRARTQHTHTTLQKKRATRGASHLSIFFLLFANANATDVNATGVNATDTHDGEADKPDDAQAALLAACQLWEPAAYVYSCTLPLWTIMLAYWLWAVWYRHRFDALDLHRMLLWIPAVEVRTPFLRLASRPHICPI